MGVVGSAGAGSGGVRIEVDPETLIRAGQRMGALGTQLGMLSDALGAALASGIASGIDPAGAAFGLQYGRQAQDFADGLAKAANSFKAVGYMLEATGYNYKNADAASTVGGPGPTGGVGGAPAETTPPDVPTGPNSAIVPPPLKWSLIQPFLRMIPGIGMFASAAMTWPSGNPSLMRLTAAQWRNLADGLSVFDEDMAALKTVVSVQKIPEGAKIDEALTTLAGGMTALANSASAIAQSIESFANGVQHAQDAIRRLLDRLSLDGLWDTVTGFLTGEGDDILREVARDVGDVLENFQQQVKGVVGLLEELATVIGDAATAFQKWVRPILVETFGEEVGGGLADAVTLYTDFQVGLTTGLINTVSGTVALADPDTWKGMAEVAMSVAEDPSTLDDVLVNMGKEFVAWDQWSGDHPGRAAGEAAFNIGSLFVPGGPLTKTGTVAKGLTYANRLFDEGRLPRLGDLPGLGPSNRGLEGLDDLPGLAGGGVPEIPEFRPGAIPESIIGGGAPNGVDVPSSPHSPGVPAGPPDPPGPTGTPGGGNQNGGGAGDGPPPDSPGRPVGPPESGPGHADGPAAQSPATSPGDSQRFSEPSAPSNMPSAGDQTPPATQHAPESSSPAGTHDADRSPSDGQTPSSHEPRTSEASGNGHATEQRGGGSGVGDDTGYASSESHWPGSDYSGRPDGPTQAPAEHQPAHTPAAEQPSGHERPATDGSQTREQPQTSGDGDGRRNEPVGTTPGVMAGVGAPMASHVAASTTSAADGQAPASRTPESPGRSPDAKVPQAGSPESPRAQQPDATGPAPGSTPAAPVDTKQPAAGEPHGPRPASDPPKADHPESGGFGEQKPSGDGLPNSPSPNNPPHTGLHDPPANHAPPGERLPDLTDINNEYRLPNGAVDPDRFNEWAEKVAEAYPTITKEGVEGVYNYTTQNYQGINPYLRNVDELSLQQSGILEARSIVEMTDAQRTSWEAQIKQTDEGLAALPPYRADPADATSTTWRGIQASDSLLDRLKVGDTFSDPGYLSTSTNPQVAEAFARANPDATPTLVTVVGRDGVDVKDLSRWVDESEILFPRSTQFEVVFREMGPDGLLRITLRQIDP